MITEQQRKERINYLGSTDCPAILGMSRYSSPLKVWAIKTGQIDEEDISDKLQVKLGNKMEQVVAELFEEETGKKLYRVNETKFHKDYPFLAANIDRRVVGENSIVEIKTASAWRSKEFEGNEIPPENILQVYHQMAVTGMSKAYLCVLIGNSELQIKEIERDEKIIADILRREMLFWNGYVVPKIMPKLITKNDADTLDQLFPQAMVGKEVALPAEADQLAEFLSAYKQDLKNLEGLIEKTENELKAMIKEGEIGITPLHKIGWSNSKWSGLDGKALKTELPEVHEKYYRSKPTRRFTCKKINQGE